jgi:hypothetical protein
MKKLWNRAFELFRRHIVLWVPCSIAGILMIALGRLEKVEIHWLFGFFERQRSVLGGVAPSADIAQVQHRVMMVMYPLGFLKNLLEVCLFVVALATTKSLVCMILEAQRPDMVAALRGIVPQYWEVLLFSLKYMAVMALFGGALTLLASSPLTPEHFHEFVLSKAFIFVFSLVGEGCLAWLLVPAAVRMLRPLGSPIVSAQDRQMGTIFAVATSAGTLALESLISKAESTLMLDNQWESDAIAAANAVIINTPQLLLFIALALLAIKTSGEETPLVAEPEMN